MFDKKFIYAIVGFFCGVLATPTACKLYNLLLLTGSTMTIRYVAVSVLFITLLLVVFNAWQSLGNIGEKTPHFTLFRLIGGIGAIWLGLAYFPSIYTNPINILYGAMLGAVGLYGVVVIFYVGLVPSARNNHISCSKKE